MFDWRQRKRVGEGRGPQARRRSRALLGVLIGMALLALPLAAEEAAKAATDGGLQARGRRSGRRGSKRTMPLSMACWNRRCDGSSA